MDTDFYCLTTPELNLEAKDARFFSRAKATLIMLLQDIKYCVVSIVPYNQT